MTESIDSTAREAIDSTRAVVFLRAALEPLAEGEPVFTSDESGAMEIRARLLPGEHVHVLGCNIYSTP